MLESDSTTAEPKAISTVRKSAWVMSDFVVMASLVIVTFLMRLPFFFPAVLDWDESTFILVGQSLLDGHLPYTQLWEFKPPLAFAFYSSAIALFGRDIVGIRLAGMLCVVVVSCLVYLTTRRLWNRQTGLIAALLSIPAITLLTSGQTTMTEHVALVPLMGATCLLVCRRESNVVVFAAGMLMAVASLVRLNLAYGAVAAGAYIAVVSIREPRLAMRRLAAYSAGGVLIVALTWLPYLLIGQQNTWWLSVIVAPLKFTGSKQSLLSNLVTQGLYAIGIYAAQDSGLHHSALSNLVRHGLRAAGVYGGGEYRFDIQWFPLFVWLAALGGLATVVFRWRSFSGSGRRGIALLVLLALATAFGILKGGTPQQHYLIMLAPFAAVLAATLIGALPGRMKMPALVIAAVLMAVSMTPVFYEYKSMVHRLYAHQDLRYGSAYEVAGYLKRHNPEGRPVYLQVDHIAYWFMNSVPPTKLAHPALIKEPLLLHFALGSNVSAEDEINNVFRQSPEFVVVGDNLGWLQGEPRVLFDDLLRKRYVLATEIGGREIYRLKWHHP